jgi:hypothetical protein
MRRLRAVALIAVLAAALPGCAFYSTVYSYDGPKMLTTAPGLGGEARVVGRFAEHERQFYLFYGLLPLGHRVNGARMAADALGEHDAAINLRMSDGQDALDMVVSYVPCLLGLLCGTWSTWVKGDIVDLTGPPGETWARPDVTVGDPVGPLGPAGPAVGPALPAKRDESADAPEPRP